jgi:hypothetical protein
MHLLEKKIKIKMKKKSLLQSTIICKRLPMHMGAVKRPLGFIYIYTYIFHKKTQKNHNIYKAKN